MSTKIKLLSDEKVTYSGFYDFDELYMHLWRWLEWHKFSIEEKKYSEKKKMGGDAESKDLEILWESSKGYDEYTDICIDVRFSLVGMKDVEVARGTAKVKMQTGELNIWVTAYMKLDKDDRYEKSPGLKFFRHFFEKYLYKNTIEQLKKDVWKIGWDFHSEIKAFLNLYKYS